MSDERAKWAAEKIWTLDGRFAAQDDVRYIIAAEYADVIAENERLREEARSEYDANVKTSHELLAARDRIASLEQQVAELRADAERYRQGISAFAHKLCVRADGESLWRYCEPDPLVGHTFDEAWDAAIDAARSR